MWVCPNDFQHPELNGSILCARKADKKPPPRACFMGAYFLLPEALYRAGGGPHTARLASLTCSATQPVRSSVLSQALSLILISRPRSYAPISLYFYGTTRRRPDELASASLQGCAPTSRAAGCHESCRSKTRNRDLAPPPGHHGCCFCLAAVKKVKPTGSAKKLWPVPANQHQWCLLGCQDGTFRFKRARAKRTGGM